MPPLSLSRANMVNRQTTDEILCQTNSCFAMSCTEHWPQLLPAVSSCSSRTTAKHDPLYSASSSSADVGVERKRIIFSSLAPVPFFQGFPLDLRSFVLRRENRRVVHNRVLGKIQHCTEACFIGCHGCVYVTDSMHYSHTSDFKPRKK